MSKLYVTFGQVHVHSVNGKTFDKDCVAVIECQSEEKGRDFAFESFGPKWCFAYFDDAWNEDNMKYYPRGYINV